MRLRINIQKIISFTVAYMVSFMGLLSCGNAITNAMGFYTSIDTALMYVTLWGLAVFVWLYVLKQKYFKSDVFFATFLIGVMYLLTLIFFQENTKYIFSASYTYANHPILVFFVYSYTGFIAIRYLDDYEYLLKYLTLLSYVVVFASAIVFFVIKDTFAAQYMVLSYNMLLQVCFLMIFPPAKGKILNNIVVGIGMFIVIFGGARGAVVGLSLVFVLYFFGFNKGHLTINSIIKTMLFFFGILCIILYYNQFIITATELIDKIGFTSRNLILLLNSSEDISSGRFEMFSKMLDSMNLFGHGLYGDRVVLNGRYAHNLFFEWFIEYGVLLGTVLSFGYIMTLQKSFKIGDDLSKKLMLVCIPNGLVGLLFSSSYLAQQPAFYILLGISINAIVKKKNISTNYDD